MLKTFFNLKNEGVKITTDVFRWERIRSENKVVQLPNSGKGQFGRKRRSMIIWQLRLKFMRFSSLRDQSTWRRRIPCLFENRRHDRRSRAHTSSSTAVPVWIQPQRRSRFRLHLHCDKTRASANQSEARRIASCNHVTSPRLSQGHKGHQPRLLDEAGSSKVEVEETARPLSVFFPPQVTSSGSLRIGPFACNGLK